MLIVFLTRLAKEWTQHIRQSSTGDFHRSTSSWWHHKCGIIYIFRIRIISRLITEFNSHDKIIWKIIIERILKFCTIYNSYERCLRSFESLAPFSLVTNNVAYYEEVQIPPPPSQKKMHKKLQRSQWLSTRFGCFFLSWSNLLILSFRYFFIKLTRKIKFE